jgi:hypothetical protein
MTKLLRIAGALFVSGLMSVQVFAQKVNYDYNKAANFANLKSYSLKSATGADNPLVDQRINDAIIRGLSMRGMRINNDNPDVCIVPRLTVEIRKQVTAYNNGWGPGWYGYPGWSGYYGGWGVTTFEVEDLQFDTLTIDMLDPQTGALLWRGTGVKQVNPSWKPEKVDRKVNETVAKILRNFPPGRYRD